MRAAMNDFHPRHAAPDSRPIETPEIALPRVAVRVDRLKLAKRLWRGVADDGEEFGFELEKPLQPGDVVFQNEKACYVIGQEPELVLEISLAVAPRLRRGSVGQSAICISS